MKKSSEKRVGDMIGVSISYHTINIKKYNINYIVTGEGPPLVLVHGGNIGWGHWYPNIKELSEHFTVYALDLPGGGRSTKIDFKKMNLEADLVDIVVLFIKKLNLQKLYILGASMGGWIATRVALLEPERVEKLVVVDSVGFSNITKLPDKIMSLYLFAKLMSKTVFKTERKNVRLEKLLRDVFYDDSIYIPREFIDYFYDTMQKSHNILYISRLSNKMARMETYLKYDITKIKSKTLVLWGRHDKFMPVEESEGLFSLINNVQIKIIEKAGHIPSIERPKIFNNMVITFLK